jgi:cardiolipin synthase
MSQVRALANQAFSRAAGAPLIEGNAVQLLIDARENYPAWLSAIAAARRHILLENYIIYEDHVGQRFAEALIAKAQQGVCIRVIYDVLGCFGKASNSYWTQLRAAGIEVRGYNPPKLESPFGWLGRDHRKTLCVDSEVGFVTGLCIGKPWEGDPEKNLEPWRDTGVAVRGPAVAEIELAFAQLWATMGEPIPLHELTPRDQLREQGNVRLRVVASVPAIAGMLRLDQLVAALATSRLWLADAYYAGTSGYAQALCAAARDGVDVRLLVPNATDIPILQPLSRSGYRPLLEAGVRVFEWNGSMMHAKTAVTDGRWARVGSTNLNIASWLGNCEMDVVVEHEAFAHEMEERYLTDLDTSTELVLDARKKMRAPNQPRKPGPARRDRRARREARRGSMTRAAAGAIRLGNAVGAAFTSHRVLEPVEARLTVMAGAVLFALGVLFAAFPRVLAYPLAAILGWISIALLYRGYTLYKHRDDVKARAQLEQTAAGISTPSEPVQRHPHE